MKYLSCCPRKALEELEGSSLGLDERWLREVGRSGVVETRKIGEGLKANDCRLGSL